MAGIQPEYSDKAIKRQHRPIRKHDHRDYRNCLRLEFEYRCVYCLATEMEVGPGKPFGGYEVEHFRPTSRYRNLRTIYRNLFWACPDCNRAKGDTWPSNAEIAAGYEFVDPCEKPLGEHLQIVGTAVRTRTTCGEYMVEEINLNSAVHRHRRVEREKRSTRLGNVLRLLRATTPEKQRELDEVRRALEALLPPEVPWDATSNCACDRGA